MHIVFAYTFFQHYEEEEDEDDDDNDDDESDTNDDDDDDDEDLDAEVNYDRDSPVDVSLQHVKFNVIKPLLPQIQGYLSMTAPLCGIFIMLHDSMNKFHTMILFSHFSHFNK